MNIKYLLLILSVIALVYTQPTLLRVNDISPNIHVLDDAKDTLQLLLQVKPDVHYDEKKIKRIENIAGHTLGHFLGKDTYIVKASPDKVNKLKELEDVVWIGEYKSGHKYLRKSFPKMKNELEKKFLKRKTTQFQRKGFLELFKTPKETSFTLVVNVLLDKSIPIGSSLKTMATQTVSELQQKLKLADVDVKSIIVASPEKLVITLAEEDSQKALEIISAHSHVHWIEKRPRNYVMNKWTKPILQSGTPSQHPLAAKGITGKGQIVGVGDSGLDPYSCHFYDPNTPVNYVYSPEPTSSNHRKIAGYWGLIDNVEDDDGHGTHVTGTVLGQTKDEISPFNGVAEDAKVIFTDLGCIQDGGCTCSGVPCDCDNYEGKKCPKSGGSIFIPLDLNEHYFPFSYNSGARIHTNSWGGGAEFGYSSQSAEIDQFSWDNKDFLILFAAGNEADYLGYMSLSTQSEAKNSLIVGASMNDITAFRYIAENIEDYNARAKYVAAELSNVFGCNDPTCKEKQYPFAEICEFLNNFDEEKCCSSTGYCTGGQGCGCRFQGIDIGSFCCKKCYTAMMNSPDSEFSYNKENLAFFSSRGPTVDGRIKPDIVAPGHSLVSTRSHLTTSPKICDTSKPLNWHLISMGGTSMATPATAGSAALVRDYFINGHYPGSIPFEPSAALVKAVLINSAQSLTGILEYNGYPIPINAPFVNRYALQGFGRITLQNTLQFSDSEFTLFIGRQGDKSKDPKLKHGERHYYCLSVNTKRSLPFKATLVWTDFPSTPAASSHLVNNLDLVVRDSNETIRYGNSDSYYKYRDNKNNVEQVEISINGQAPKGDYVVVIEATDVPQGPQPYALVITGDIQERKCTTKEKESFEEPKESMPAGGVAAIAILATLVVILGISTIVSLVVVYSLYIKNRKISTHGIQFTDAPSTQMVEHFPQEDDN